MGLLFSPGPRIDQTEILDIANAVSGLPHSNREAIIQIFWNGYTEAEIVKQLGISQRAVSKRKQVSLKHLKSMLPDEC